MHNIIIINEISILGLGLHNGSCFNILSEKRIISNEQIGLRLSKWDFIFKIRNRKMKKKRFIADNRMCRKIRK